jgi:DNA invertase Pin-like site-specific DNA recombinase
VKEGAVVVGYVRVSTDGQAESGAGLDAQRLAIQRACEQRGWTLLRVDEDAQTGKTLNRPGLARALSACRSGEVDGLVVAKLDRLSRSIVDFSNLIQEARKRNFNVAALDLGLDLSTPQGELVANVISSVAQWERRIIGERTKDALAAKRRAGVRLGRPSNIPEGVARRILRERASGRTYWAIASGLDEDSIPTAQGGRRWYPATVRHALLRASG